MLNKKTKYWSNCLIFVLKMIITNIPGDNWKKKLDCFFVKLLGKYKLKFLNKIVKNSMENIY